jgi:hypothetical protein
MFILFILGSLVIGGGLFLKELLSQDVGTTSFMDSTSDWSRGMSGHTVASTELTSVTDRNSAIEAMGAHQALPSAFDAHVGPTHNLDGTPMMGGIDALGRLWGDTSSMEASHVETVQMFDSSAADCIGGSGWSGCDTGSSFGSSMGGSSWD